MIPGAAAVRTASAIALPYSLPSSVTYTLWTPSDCISATSAVASTFVVGTTRAKVCPYVPNDS